MARPLEKIKEIFRVFLEKEGRGIRSCTLPDVTFWEECIYRCDRAGKNIDDIIAIEIFKGNNPTDVEDSYYSCSVADFKEVADLIKPRDEDEIHDRITLVSNSNWWIQRLPAYFGGYYWDLQHIPNQHPNTVQLDSDEKVLESLVRYYFTGYVGDIHFHAGETIAQQRQRIIGGPERDRYYAELAEYGLTGFDENPALWIYESVNMLEDHKEGKI